MTRIDLTDPLTAPALELLGSVIDDARAAGVEALIESLSWRDGAMARDTEAIVLAAVIAHDMGAPLLKVPVPDVPAGGPPDRGGGPGGAKRRRAGAVPRGPRGDAGRQAVLDEISDAMAGGAAGMAIGRQVFGDPEPEKMARLVADAVHGG